MLRLMSNMMEQNALLLQNELTLRGRSPNAGRNYLPDVQTGPMNAFSEQQMLERNQREVAHAERWANMRQERLRPRPF